MTHSDDQEAPPVNPADALRLIREQQAEAVRRLNPDVRFYYWPWGFAWLVGFGLLFLRFGPDGRVFVDLPLWLPLNLLFVLLVAAGVVSGIASAKAYGQVTGESSRRGAWYGLAWAFGFASVLATVGRVAGNLPDDQAGLLWSGTAVGLTGALHIAGGAVWLDRNMLRLGIWIAVINIVGVLAGPGWHALVISVAGGGGMLVAGTIAGLRHPDRAEPRAGDARLGDARPEQS